MSAPDSWQHDAETVGFVLRVFVPALAAFSLAWEAAHVRLYTLWTEAGYAYVVFAVLHCTAGDLLIGTLALLASLMLLRAPKLREWRIAPIALLSTLIATSYTIWSEWLNVEIREAWAYAEAMPRLPLGSFELGLSPLLQWLLVPTLSLCTARALRP